MVSARFLFGVVLFMFVVPFSSSLSAARKIEVGHDFEALEPSPPILGKEILYAVVPSEAVARNGRVSGRKMKMFAMEMVSEEGKLNVERKLRGANSAPKPEMGSFMDFTSDYHVPKPHPPKNN